MAFRTGPLDSTSKTTPRCSISPSEGNAFGCDDLYTEGCYPSKHNCLAAWPSLGAALAGADTASVQKFICDNTNKGQAATLTTKEIAQVANTMLQNNADNPFLIQYMDNCGLEPVDDTKTCSFKPSVVDDLRKLYACDGSA